MFLLLCCFRTKHAVLSTAQSKIHFAPNGLKRLFSCYLAKSMKTFQDFLVHGKSSNFFDVASIWLSVRTLCTFNFLIIKPNLALLELLKEMQNASNPKLLKTS